ncbi:trypsin-7-like isoform X10 [Leptidea sinapis]|uniref:trypsin-7-like isoform X10 n=1 Tax=Leptidea sinapis TaxID=189913 RepID=UPI0021C49DFE|nr:trypsin-7-like isoform X10 [Leptidea sinapis]
MVTTKLLFIFVATLLAQGAYCNENIPPNLEDSKIVGGYSTTILKFPYQVLVILQHNGQKRVCGGSILNEEFILTAAHCVDDVQSAVVAAGITDDRETEKLIPVKHFEHHPNYNPKNFDYDVAYLQLCEKLNLDGRKKDAVHIVKAGSQVPVSTKVTVSGWGNTAENGTLSDVLRAVELNIVSVFECRKVYGKKDITQRMICAGVPKGGKDNCQGDSGGPLVYSSTRKQVGIVSSGYGCARPGVPGIYTNLANPGIRSWIKKHTGA